MKQCKAKGIPVVEDDIYSELWFEGSIPKSMKELDTSHNVLYLGSLSKTVSPGLRIGWLIGNERVINHLADLKMQMTMVQVRFLNLLLLNGWHITMKRILKKLNAI